MAVKCPKCQFENPDNARFCGNCTTPLLSPEDIQVSRTKTFKIPMEGLTTGSNFAGRYQIIEELGRGGMGIVYKAEDTKLKRTIALKFLSPFALGDEKEKVRFEREAQAAAALDHPNICTIYEVGEAEEQSFIAMAYVKGKSLKKKIESGPLNLDEILDITTQIAEGLQEAHEKGIIHRDIKSSNIMITEKDRAKIMDFGIAKLVGQTKLTKATTIMGTLAYMSPEQSQGELVDHRSDIWSLGIVLYEMSTSQLPFKEEDNAALIHSVINESPTPPMEIREDIPKEMEKLIFKCLRKDPKDRCQSARQFLTNMKRLKNTIEKKEQEAIAEEREKSEIKKGPERRQTTVMFAEISGYKEILERMEAEEAASIMNSCFEMIGSIARKHGGTIDKIMESSIQVLFGAPTAIENAPKEAINAAIDVRNQLYRFNQEKNMPIPLDIHIGINTGTVIAGAMGADEKRDYTVMGDTVSFASQLKDLSSKGQIYVGPSTHKYTRNEFDYKPLKPTTLKGKTKPIRVFELLSTQERIYRPAIGSERIIYSEMVGRNKELDKLKLHVLKVINGEGSIVSVIGEAGIGKSRLITELRNIEDLKKVKILEGRSLSIGRNLSYHPIIDIIKNWAGIKEGDSEIESMSKLETAIHNIYPEGVAEIFPFVVVLIGMKLTGKHADRIKGIEGEAMEKLILKNIRELMIKGAELRPTVFIIEDLHWADMSSIELLESLFRLAEKHRILFINVLRPGYQESGEQILETIRERYGKVYSEIFLEPLDEKQCEILIQNLIKVKGLPPEIRAAIANRAEGNPFFIEEVVRSFFDEGVIELRDGKFKVTEKIDSVEIPESIQDVLMARIDRLDETTKDLLKEASVIGRYFFYKILAKVARSIKDIDDKLEFLKGVQLVRERIRLEEIEFLFEHVLAQEVTYESILLNKRKELHLKVANAIEDVFSERLYEFYGMLALHYSRGENLEKAEEYLIRAGEEALKAAASNEALNYYQEALKLYLKKYGDAADPRKIAMLEKNIALAFYNKGRMVEALECLDRVLEYWGVRRPKSKLIALLNLIADLLSVVKNLYFPSKRVKKIPENRDVEIINLIERRGAAFAQADPTRFFMESIGIIRRLNKFDITKVKNGVSIYIASSFLFSITGISFKLSRKILDYTKDYISEDDIKSAFRFRYLELMHNFLKGEWDKEPEYDEVLVDHNTKIGDVFYASSYTQWNSFLKIGQGNFSGVDALLEKLSKIGESYGHELAIGRKYSVKAELLLNCRKLYDAQNEIDEAVIFFNRIGIKLYSIFVLGMKTYVQILLNDIEGAKESLLHTKELVSREKRILPFYINNYLMSQFFFDIYMLNKSINSNDKSVISSLRKKAYRSGKVAINNSMKFAANKIDAFKLMGKYYWLIGKQKKALVWWDKSTKVGEQLGARPELARTYMEVGKRLLEKESKFHQLNGIPTQEYLEKAKVIFQELKLEWDLEELDKIKGQLEHKV